MIVNSTQSVQDCSICCDPLVKKLAITSCNHLFHYKCLANWIKQTHSCPMCRNEDLLGEKAVVYPVIEGSTLQTAIEKIGIIEVKQLLVSMREDPLEHAQVLNQSPDTDQKVIEIVEEIIAQIAERASLQAILCKITQDFKLSRYEKVYLSQDTLSKHLQKPFNRTMIQVVSRRRDFLALSGLNLTQIPEDLTIFCRITMLHLSNNFLTTLPVGVGQLQNLVTLEIENNLLGSLPKEIGDLPRLRNILAANNQITSLPQEIKSCTGLRYVNLKNNPLEQSREEIQALLPEQCEVILD